MRYMRYALCSIFTLTYVKYAAFIGVCKIDIGNMLTYSLSRLGRVGSGAAAAVRGARWAAARGGDGCGPAS